MERTYCVYKHTFPNGKVYIGITGQRPTHRWNNGKGYGHKQQYVASAIKKYGWENISHEIIEDGLTKEQACCAEIRYIKLYKSNERKYGYNVANGGDGSFSIAESTREKMRQNNLGKVMPEQTKKKIGESNKAYWKTHKKVQPKDAAKKCWESRRRNGNTEPWNKGISYGGTMVVQREKNGTEVNRYPSSREAARLTGISCSHINQCCNGIRKSAGKYKWTYD